MAFMTQEAATGAQLSAAAATLATVPATMGQHKDVQMLDSGGGRKLDPATPTTTTSPEPEPGCGEIDIAKLTKGIRDEEKRLRRTRRID